MFLFSYISFSKLSFKVRLAGVSNDICIRKRTGHFSNLKPMNRIVKITKSTEKKLFKRYKPSMAFQLIDDNEKILMNSLHREIKPPPFYWSGSLQKVSKPLISYIWSISEIKQLYILFIYTVVFYIN